MKRIYLPLAGIVFLAAAASPAALAHSPARARSASAVSVELRHTSLGTILTSGSGFTVYAFTRDHGDRNSCAGVHGCEQVWPALQTHGVPGGGSGVQKSLLGTIKLSGGRTQVTYAGHPLYLYRGDSGPGQTDYVGVSEFGGNWDAINSAGHLVK